MGCTSGDDQTQTERAARGATRACVEGSLIGVYGGYDPNTNPNDNLLRVAIGRYDQNSGGATKINEVRPKLR